METKRTHGTRKGKIKEKTEITVPALQTARPQGTEDQNTSCDSCGQSGHWKKDCPRRQEPQRGPSGPCPIRRGSHWKADCPQRPSRHTGLKGLGVLTVAPLTQLFMGMPGPHMTLEVEGKPMYFLLDTGATLSVLLSNPGTPSTPWLTI